MKNIQKERGKRKSSSPYPVHLNELRNPLHELAVKEDRSMAYFIKQFIKEGLESRKRKVA